MTTANVVAVGVPQIFRQQVAWALETDPERVRWVPTVTAAEEHLVGEGADADVLVVAPGIKEHDAIGLAKFVSRTSPATAVVVVRDRGIMNGFLPEAMRAGIRDVVDLSKGSAELKEALRHAVEWSAKVRAAGTHGLAVETAQKQGTVISVFSSKGGTGKTFLTVNLAAALAHRSGQETAIVDLEFELGDVFAYFGEEPRLALHDLLAIGDLSAPEDVRRSGRQMGDHLWAFAVHSEPGAESVSGEAVGKVLRAIRGAFSYVVVDASAQYSDHALASFDVSDAVYLITGLDIVGIRHLSVALRTMRSLALPAARFRIALNRADSKVGLDPAEVERVLNVRVDAKIPSSRLVPSSLNKGRPVYADEPKSDVAKAIGQLADQIISEGAAETNEEREAAEAATGRHRKPGLFKRG